MNEMFITFDAGETIINVSHHSMNITWSWLHHFQDIRKQNTNTACIPDSKGNSWVLIQLPPGDFPWFPCLYCLKVENKEVHLSSVSVTYVLHVASHFSQCLFSLEKLSFTMLLWMPTWNCHPRKLMLERSLFLHNMFSLLPLAICSVSLKVHCFFPFYIHSNTVYIYI